MNRPYFLSYKTIIFPLCMLKKHELISGINVVVKNILGSAYTNNNFIDISKIQLNVG